MHTLPNDIAQTAENSLGGELSERDLERWLAQHHPALGSLGARALWAGYRVRKARLAALALQG